MSKSAAEGGVALETQEETRGVTGVARQGSREGAQDKAAEIFETSCFKGQASVVEFWMTCPPVCKQHDP